MGAWRPPGTSTLVMMTANRCEATTPGSPLSWASAARCCAGGFVGSANADASSGWLQRMKELTECCARLAPIALPIATPPTNPIAHPRPIETTRGALRPRARYRIAVPPLPANQPPRSPRLPAAIRPSHVTPREGRQPVQRRGREHPLGSLEPMPSLYEFIGGEEVLHRLE